MTNGVQSTREELGARCVGVKASACLLDLHGEEVRGVEAWVDGEQMAHAAEQQTGADEEDEGKRDLDDDQDASGCVTVADRAAGVLFETGAEAGTGGMKRRDEAHDDAEDGGDGEREEEDAAMEADGVDPRKSGRAERDEGFDSASGDKSSAECAEGGEEETFGEKLADETGPCRSESGANGELGLALGSSGEEKIGYVDAGDEKDERDGSENGEEGRADGLGDVVLKGIEENSAGCAAGAVVPFGVKLCKSWKD